MEKTVKENRLPRLLSLLFVAGFFVAAMGFNAVKPRVLVLHSYDPDYAWTRDIDIGIRRVADHWSDYALSWHYMDTKRQGDKDWLRRAGIAARRAIERVEPHVLIAVDDLAQELAAKYYVDHPHIQIVFTGVNGSAEPYGYEGAANVTGIFERKPLRAVKEMIQALEAGKPEPDPRPRLAYLLDPSPSMLRDRDYIEQFDWGPLEFTGSVVVKDFAAWRRAVEELGGKIDYLLVANYRKLPYSADDPKYPPATEIMTWTEEHSPVPVIGVNVFNVEDGGAIAVGASPFEQGTVAAKRAETILEHGVTAGSLPFMINRQYVVAIHRDALQRRGLVLPQVYETFARTTATYIER